MLLRDLSPDLAAAAARAHVSTDQLNRWITGSMFDDLESLPSVGMYRALTQQRYLNVGTRWKPNDLTDMVYLSAACAYCDVVVTERYMGAMLAQASRQLGRPVNVFSSLSGGVKLLTQRLTERERGGATDP